MDDNESIDKSSLYHEPFNVNMYTSAASGCSLNDLQRNHVTPDYTGNGKITKYHTTILVSVSLFVSAALKSPFSIIIL